MAIDINATMNSMMDSAKSAVSKAGEKLESVFDILTQTFDRMVAGVSKNLGMGFIKDLGSKSAVAQFEAQGLQAINPNASSLTANSKVGNAFMELAKSTGLDKVSAPAVEALSMLSSEVHQGTHVSYGELGTLTPTITFGGNVVSQGMSIG